MSRLRPPKCPKAEDRDAAAFSENETLPDGRPGTVLTLILSNRACPYRCVFCGLWQDMMDETPAPGVVARQVERAIDAFGPRDAIKLYNAGSFFDEQAIPAANRDRIAELVRPFRWVMVESRPELVDDRAVRFADRLPGRLHIAVGLEVADDQILAFMNKRMTLASVRRAGRFMQGHDLSWRAFVMVQPPWVAPGEAVPRACAAVDFAVDCGADAVSLIRTYATPGAMEALAEHGFWMPPDVWAVYETAQWSLKNASLVTLVDRWSLDRSPTCEACFASMDAAFETLNTEQRLPTVTCACRDAYTSSLQNTSVRSVDEYRACLRDWMRGL